MYIRACDFRDVEVKTSDGNAYRLGFEFHFTNGKIGYSVMRFWGGDWIYWGFHYSAVKFELKNGAWRAYINAALSVYKLENVRKKVYLNTPVYE